MKAPHLHWLFVFTFLLTHWGILTAGPKTHPSPGQSIISARGEDGSYRTGPEININVTRIYTSPKIDGRLDEEVWQQAPAYEDHFFQQEPGDRMPATSRTRVIVLQDENSLYFGIRAYEEDATKVLGTTMRRDSRGAFRSDDIIQIMLDTFNDKRNCYAFATNPLGMKTDAIVTDEGSLINNSWDGVWECSTHIDDAGWCAEMAIPFKTLQYRTGDVVEWGFNVTREVRHTNETTYLVPIPRGLGHIGKYKPSLYANLHGISPPASGFNFEILPYATAGRASDYGGPSYQSLMNTGVDLRYQITPQLTIDGTLNTDFSQVETDREIVNTTRFNINLPEKRGFFLESQGLFSFGIGNSAGGSVMGSRSFDRPSFMLFNSRTIGIVEEEQIPLYGGGKVAGRIEKYGVGLMNLQSRRYRLQETGEIIPSTNFAAFRVKRDLLTNSSIGLMVLNKTAGEGDYNRAAGTDAYLSLSQQVSLSGFAAKTFSPGITSRDWAGSGGFVVNTNWFDLSLKYTFLDSLFNPEMGFIQRENIRALEGLMSLTRWIDSGAFQYIALVNRLDYITDHHDVLQTRNNGLDLWIMLRSGDFLSAGVQREYEFLTSFDEIQEIVIEPGTYRGLNADVMFRTYSGRPVSAFSYIRYGRAFGGTAQRIYTSLDFNVSHHLTLEVTYQYNRLKLENGLFQANLFSGRINYSFSPRMYVKAFLQYNDAEERISNYFLFDYIYKPRSHIYLVYTEDRNPFPNAPYPIRDRMVQLKFTYLWML